MGLLGAGLLAAAILPLSTAYSVSEAVGVPNALDRRVREAPVFYGVYAFVVVIAAGLVLLPNAPLVAILYLTQALNAILLVPLLVLIIGLATNQHLMGEHAVGSKHSLILWLITAVITLCVAALFWLTLF